MSVPTGVPGGNMPPGTVGQSWVGGIWDWATGKAKDISASVSTKGGTVGYGGLEWKWGVDAEGNSGMILTDPNAPPGTPAFLPMEKESALQKYGTFLLIGGLALAVYFVTK